MTKRDVLEIGIKVVGIIFGVYWIMNAIFLGFRALSYALSEKSPPVFAIALGAVYIVLMLLAILALLRWGGAIARKLTPDDAQVLPAEWSGFDVSIFHVTLRCVGLALLATALIGLCRTIVYDAEVNGFRLGRSLYWYVNSLIEIATGAYLFFGGRAVLRLVMLKRDEGKEAAGSAPAVPPRAEWEKPLFRLGVRLFGIWFFVWYGAMMLRAFAEVWLPVTLEQEIGKQDFYEFVHCAVLLALSVYMLLGAKHVVNRLYPKQRPAAEDSGNG